VSVLHLNPQENYVDKHRLSRFLLWSFVGGGLGFSMGFKDFNIVPTDAYWGALLGVLMGIFVASLFDSASKP
jgi:hypothetical protein